MAKFSPQSRFFALRELLLPDVAPVTPSLPIVQDGVPEETGRAEFLGQKDDV